MKKEFDVGDEVCISQSYCDPVLSKVARLTKTMVVLDDGSRWGKDGWYKGAAKGFSISSIKHITPEIKLEIRQKKLVRHIRAAVGKRKFDDLSVSRLERIFYILNEVE